MSKITLIIEREYLTRVRKKSFIIMSVVGPLLIAALYAVPVWLAMRDNSSVYQIAVVDTQNELKSALTNTDTHRYTFIDVPIDSINVKLAETGNYDAILYRNDKEKFNKDGLVLLSTKQVNVEMKKNVERSVAKFLRNRRMEKLGLNKATLDSMKINVSINTRKLTDKGEAKASSGEMAMVIGFVLAMFIYFIIFLYGAQVMRGVIEEKTNRIVELMISSVRPFELMMGKILGVALVVLTQIAIWIGLSALIIFAVSNLMGSLDTDMAQKLATSSTSSSIAASTPQMEAIKPSGVGAYIEAFWNMNLGVILFGFVFFFIGGYLTYASLFAAVGAAVDNETDTQQFMLPISLPMVLAFVVGGSIIREPDSALAVWMSIIPFTSPIAMVLRLPQEPPMWQLLLSMGLLVISFIFTTWIASRIYRVGILMYGKKISYKELWKWLWYKA